MQIYYTSDGREYVVSEYVRATFNKGRLTILFKGRKSSCPAELGSTFIVKRFDDKLSVQAVTLPKDYCERVGYCLSFDPKKCCHSLEEFLERVTATKEEYPSPKFSMHTNDKSYAFLVAKKQSAPRKHAPLLLWVDENITPEEAEELIQKYRKYRKIYHDLDFTNLILNQK